jgi:hypothetical protein
MQQQMNDMTYEIEQAVEHGRNEVDRIVSALVDSARSTNRSQRVAAGVALASMAAIGIGVVVYQRRRRHTLADRIKSALPDSILELPRGIKAAAKRRGVRG